MQRDDNSSLEMLVTVSRLLSSKLELDDLLNYIMKLAARVVGAERASLYLIDPNTGELYFDVALGLDPEIQKIRLKPGQGIAGRAVSEARSVIVNDVDLDASHHKAIDQKSGFTTKTVIACPMIVKGNVIGVVQALNRIDGPFDERDLRNFEAFAAQAAIAIENARLFSSVKEEKRLLNLVFTRMREGVVLTDENRRVKMANETAKSFTGGTGADIAEMLKGMTVKPSLEELLSSDAGATDFECERNEPKKLYLEGSVVPLMRDDGHGVRTREGWLWLFRDVTERRKEELLSRDFLSLISHKLRTPLMVINGYVEVLAEQCSGDAETVKSIATITRQSRRLGSLIEQLVNFTAVESLSPENVERKDFDLSDTVCAAARDVASLYDDCRVNIYTQDGSCQSSSCDGKIIINVHTMPACTIPGDQSLVKKAVAELIANALKFNSSLVKNVDIAVLKNGGLPHVSVKDNGAGVPPEETGKIFNKFYQVESCFSGQVEGWGLGLAFVKKIADAHGAKIEVASAAGKGSEFKILFNPRPVA